MALAAALVLPWLNGQHLDADEDQLTDFVMGIASGRIGKAEIAVFIGRQLHSADSTD